MLEGDSSPTTTTRLFQRRVKSTVILCSIILALWIGWGSPVKTAFKNNTAWCPTAQCDHGTDHTNRHDKRPSCDTCYRRFLIILAQGRSASTTLVEMLDLLPNVRMGGENNNILIRFKEMHELLEQSPYGYVGLESNQGAWKHNPVNPYDWVCLGQSLVETIYPPPPDNFDVAEVDDTDTIVGFKTIRFAMEGERVYNVSDHVDYFRALFPCARFLINIRSDAAAIASSRQQHFTSYNKRKSSLELLAKKEADMLREAAALFGNQTAMVLDSSQWTKNISLLNQAVSWLGFDEDCHFTNCWNSILTLATSPPSRNWPILLQMPGVGTMAGDIGSCCRIYLNCPDEREKEMTRPSTI
jgi:hypothetical protein